MPPKTLLIDKQLIGDTNYEILSTLLPGTILEINIEKQDDLFISGTIKINSSKENGFVVVQLDSASKKLSLYFEEISADLFWGKATNSGTENKTGLGQAIQGRDENPLIKRIRDLTCVSLFDILFIFDLQQLQLEQLRLTIRHAEILTLAENFLSISQVLLTIQALHPFGANREITYQAYGTAHMGSHLFTIYINPHNYFIRGQLTIDQNIIGTEELIQHLEGYSNKKINLPQQQIESAQLSDLEFTACLKNEGFGLESLDLELELATNWEIELGNEKFIFTNLNIYLSKDDEDFELSLTGQFQLAKIPFQLLGHYESGNWSLSGEAAPFSIHFDELHKQVRTQYSSLQTPDQEFESILKDWGGALEITKLFAEYKSLDNQFRFICNVKKISSANLPFNINSFLIGLEAAKNCFNWKAMLHIAFPLRGPYKRPIDFFLELRKGQTGFEFSASLDNFSVDDFIELLCSNCGVDKSDIPDFLQHVDLKKIDIRLYRKLPAGKWSFEFNCDANIYFGHEKYVAAKIMVQVKVNDKNEKSVFFEGTFILNAGDAAKQDLLFNIHFDKTKKSTILLGTYSHLGLQKVNLGQLIYSVCSDAQLKTALENIEIDLKDILFLYEKRNTEENDKDDVNSASTFLFALDIGTSIDLSHLPLVGKALPIEQLLQGDLQLLIVSQDLSNKEIEGFNRILPTKATPLMIMQQGSLAAESSSVVQKGLNLSAGIRWGESIKTLTLPASQKKQNVKNNLDITVAADRTISDENSEKAVWLSIQKSIGPVHLERIGLAYIDNNACILLDASLCTAGVSITTKGLSICSPLHDFKPTFDLQGLAIDYQKGDTIEIGGSFLKQVIEEDNSHSNYNGQAIIKTSAFGMTAFGSYNEKDNYSSLFLYALLDYPLGGPSFFFVTGLAAAFGYNRSLTIPPVEQIPEFPLIREAVNSHFNKTATDDHSIQMLDSLRLYIRPSPGEIFLAVGIQFSSFKIIHSFVLLSLASNTSKQIQFNVAGISNLTAPSSVVSNEPVLHLAEAKLALKATFLPDEGFLSVSAQLMPDAYVLSKNCHVTGGLAFYSWFRGKHAGDFALTLGGYHTNFEVPEHYPRVPRLGFNWQLDPHISFKGDAYMALTPAAFMAGGHLEATYENDTLKAWFYAGADFLMAWKPLHYEATIYIDIGVTYTFDLFGPHTIYLQVGAELHLWGPDFGGRAKIHFNVFTLDIAFGNQRAIFPEPVDWSTFKHSFLPAKEYVLTIILQDGLLKKSTSDPIHLGLVDPRRLCLITNTVIPFKNTNGKENNIQFGVAPMDIATDNVHSDYNILITKKGNEVPLEMFCLLPIYKSTPAALWGNKLQPDINADRLIEVIAGFKIMPRLPLERDKYKINKSELQFDNTYVHSAFAWQEIENFHTGRLVAIGDRQAVENTLLANTRRDQLLQSLGFELSSIAIMETWVNCLFETI